MVYGLIMVYVNVQEAGGRLPVRGREGQRRGSPHHGGVSVNHFTWIRILFCSLADPNPDRSDLYVWGLLDPDPDLLVSCDSDSDFG
jgi:hypothetical protein